MFGIYLDSHAGACSPDVWRLLDNVAPRCANLAGVTFEFHESYFPQLGEDGLLAEVQRIRSALPCSRGAVACPFPNSSAPLPN
jgi:hypothetical protein